MWTACIIGFVNLEIEEACDLEPVHETLGMLQPVGGRDKLQANTVTLKTLLNSNLLHSDVGDVCPEYGEQETNRFNSSISDGPKVGLSSPTDGEPLWKMTEDVSARSLPVSTSTRDKTHDTENRSNLPEENHDKRRPDTKFGQLGLSGQISPPMSPDVEEVESDEDVPYFSDVEAMVLEMDLCTHDQDPLACAKVSQYQDENAKRKIVRLEQCAHSYMDRRLKSLGAFAILYGRRLKHCIKKSEVILGRATEDMEVDIDLAREGRANKISRQQASIRLEVDGSFIETNLGKFKISVNGMELKSGQYMTLSLSNLIEVREMSFIFEASHKLVQQFRARARQTFQSQPS